MTTVRLTTFLVGLGMAVIKYINIFIRNILYSCT